MSPHLKTGDGPFQKSVPDESINVFGDGPDGCGRRQAMHVPVPKVKSSVNLALDNLANELTTAIIELNLGNQRNEVLDVCGKILTEKVSNGLQSRLLSMAGLANELKSGLFDMAEQGDDRNPQAVVHEWLNRTTAPPSKRNDLSDLETANALAISTRLMTNGGNDNHSNLSVSAVPYTPTSKRAPNGRAAKGSGRRHKRTETPEQQHLKKYTKEPIYTFGIEAQPDRGLLADFFDEVCGWASKHAADLDNEGIIACMELADLKDILGAKSDLIEMLCDKETRVDLIAAILCRHIVVHAMSEHFLYHSEHHAGQWCNQLVLEFTMLAQEEYHVKHEVCIEQKKIYTGLKNEPNHKQWRSAQAEQYSRDLILKLASFLNPDIDTYDREHTLSELYVKGYRIGFRLRMEAVKWQIIWPVAGIPFIEDKMIYRSRTMYGDAVTTQYKIRAGPENYFVRFAVTPIFTKFDYSTGFEEKEVVHRGNVRLGRCGVFSHKDDGKMP